MTWLAILFSIEMGMTVDGAMWFYEEPIPDFVDVGIANPIYTDFSAEFLIVDHVFIGGSARVDTNYSKETTTFAPFWLNWNFNAGIRFNGLEIGFRHHCAHPFRSYYWTPYRQSPTPSFEGIYEEVYIKVEGRHDIWNR